MPVDDPLPGPLIPTPPDIGANQIFTLEMATAALTPLGLGKTTLARECRLGRLHYVKRGGKCLIRGAWLLDWLEAGKVQRGQRRRRTHTHNGTPAA